MKIIREKLSSEELNKMAALFGDFVKGVVDVERELIAVDAELHSDLESLLLKDGSRQENLWGINLYPEAGTADFIEYDSMINLRPSQGNRSRSVESEKLRHQIDAIVAKRVPR
jgi:hypothetical protein